MAGLMDLKQLKCKTCGEPLSMSVAQNGVIVCAICGYSTILPKEDSTDKVRELLSHGDSYLDTGKFDDAYTMFARASEEDSEEPEAYFGMALAEFRIQYVNDLKDDGKSRRLQAIVHAISPDNFCDNLNYRKALNYATDAQRKEYERRAGEIDYIRDQFYKFKNAGLNYDCFLCLKVTDDVTKLKTPETRVAEEICTYLRRKGFKPFYSEQVLESVTGGDYEAHILYALHTAECMLIICYDEAHLRTKWVRNEYTRFLKLVNDDEKESDSITIVFGDRPIEKLPGKNGKIQGIRGKSGDMLERVYHFVERHTPEARLRKEAEEQAQKEAEEKRVAQMIEQKMRQANLGGSSANAQPVKPLLTRAAQELSMGRLDKANEYYNKVLDMQPECGDAWFGMLLLEFDCVNEQELHKKIDHAYSLDKEKHKLLFNVTSSQYGAQVKKYGDSALLTKYNALIAACNNPEGWYRMMLQDMGCGNDRELMEKIKRSYCCDKSKTDFLKKFRDSKYGERVRNCATGELRDRYEQLWAASNDPESWYKVWLREFGCSSDHDMERTLQIACCPDEKKNQLLFKFKESEYGQAVASCASGELLARHDNLIRKCDGFIEALRNGARADLEKSQAERAKIEVEYNDLHEREQQCRATIELGNSRYIKKWLKLVLFFVLFVVSAVAWFFALGSVIRYNIGAEIFKYSDLFKLNKQGVELTISELKAIGIPAFTGWGMTLFKGKATLGFIIQIIAYSFATALILSIIRKICVDDLNGFILRFVVPFVGLAIVFGVAWFFILAKYWMGNIDVLTYSQLFRYEFNGSGPSGLPIMSELGNYGISKFGGWGLTVLNGLGVFIQPLVYGIGCSIVMNVLLNVLLVIDDKCASGYRKNKVTFRAKYNNARRTIDRLNEVKSKKKSYDGQVRQMERIISRCNASLQNSQNNY